MKKKLIGVLLPSLLLFVGCGNRQILDTKWDFRKAIIVIGDREIEVDVQSWKDYTDTSIQITDTNGKTYLTNLKNVVLMDR